ncbi:MAG: DUF4832 domain-containing protein [Ruminococcaceae bacterium]|nr:DUF4832 domain-containing protein [Oscillospiraceae bacterium]
MNEPYYNRVFPTNTYIDLRPLYDDRTVLRNPHKGWYYHFIDNGLNRPYYRDGIAPGDHLEHVPGLNHLYLRIDWADIEPEEGRFDWKWLDGIFDEWSRYGYRFSFRVCCFVSNTPYSTPKWVREAGAAGTELTGCFETPFGVQEVTRWEPDYGDPIFLEKLENMLRAFGDKYNGNELVEFVDIGTFGTWGEGHTGFGSGKLWSPDVLRRHIDLHLRYLPDTTLLLNDDMVTHAARFGGADAAVALWEYAMGKGIGMRDDSLCVPGYDKHYGYDTMRAGQMTAAAAHAPVDLEFAHYRMMQTADFKNGFPLIDALAKTHATFAGFHGYADKWLDEQKNLHDYIANRLGYWYFLPGMELAECVSGLPTLMRLYVENRGFARAYHPFTLRIYAVPYDSAVSGETRYLLCEQTGANLCWESGNTACETLRLDFRGVPAGEYELCVGLYEGGRAVRFAVKENCLRGSDVSLTRFTVRQF